MDIEIPSPSVFLRHSPDLSASLSTSTERPTRPPRSHGTRPLSTSNTTTASARAQCGSVAKPKQSKSRNGCMTCKRKRLKCDETRPGCVQCEKRNVECEGYKKDYRWRFFEDTIKQSRAGRAKKTRTASAQGQGQTQESCRPAPQSSSPPSNDTRHRSSSRPSATTSTSQATTGPPSLTPTIAVTSPPQRLSPSQFEALPALNSGFSPSKFDRPPPLATSDSESSEHEEDHDGRPSTSAGLVTLTATQLPGMDPRQPPNFSETSPPLSFWPYEAITVDSGSTPDIALESGEDFDEEVANDQLACLAPDDSPPPSSFRAPSPAHSEASTSSSESIEFPLLNMPSLGPCSEEMLILRFDKETCSILSIKDGPSENPWRTLIWPLAKSSQALYHAILAMTALHGATTQPQLRLTGVAHMTKSIRKLSVEMHKMSYDQTLASVLALALGEAWDDSIGTGIQHLRGARTLINHALAQRSRDLQHGLYSETDAKRLKFLSNTYVYLVAIARLTSGEQQDSSDLNDILQAVNEPVGSLESEVDPLMGCAMTLFPLLGKVGSLIQTIRRTPTNSLTVVSEANELKEQLLQWEPPDMDQFERPEDPSSNVRHALQTAEAYRRAILLHLHSAVTELFSEPSHDQAKGILSMLAATPLSSRTMVVQIFPLLVGSCEMVHPDDRRWVVQRWEAMMRRLTLVTVASCWEIVQEVWRRRDEWADMQAQRMARTNSRTLSPRHFIPPTSHRKTHSADAVSEDAFADFHDGPHQRSDVTSGIVPRRQFVQLPRRHTDVSLLSGEVQYTVRGHLHWLGVMSDWKWEVFL